MRTLCDDVKTVMEGGLLEPDPPRSKTWWDIDDVKLVEPTEEKVPRKPSQNPVRRRLRLLHDRYPHDD